MSACKTTNSLDMDAAAASLDADAAEAQIDAALRVADLVLASFDDAHALHDEAFWAGQASSEPIYSSTSGGGGKNVSVQGAVLPPAFGDGKSNCERERVHTALSQGRVHGVSVSTLAALLTDDVFLRWFGLNRHVSMEVVPQQVWVAREIFETGLHAVPHFDFALACSCVDTPEGGKLYVERSVEHACWPRREDMARAWRYQAVLMHKCAEDSEGEDVLQVSVLVQADLGDPTLVTPYFTSEYVLASAGLIPAVERYTSKESWPAEKRRLETEGPRRRLASGPDVSPSGVMDAIGAEPPPAAVSVGGGGGGGCGVVGCGAAVASASSCAHEALVMPHVGLPKPPVSDSQLHRAQIQAFTQLRMSK